MRIDELRRPEQHFAAVAAKALRVIVLLDSIDDGLNVIADPAEVDPRLAGLQTELGAAAHQRGHPRGL